MKKTLFLLLLLLPLYIMYGCEGGPAGNNGTVRGTVVTVSMSPLAGAAVTVGGIAGTTGSSGDFELTLVPTGSQTITITAPGYISKSFAIDVAAMDVTYVPIVVLSIKDDKSTDIGPEGGTVTNSDGSVILVIPAGALSETQKFFITKCEVSSAPAPPPTGYSFLSLVNISPDISLAVKGTLTIPLPAGASSLTSVPFFRYNPESGAWESIGSGAVNSAAGTITVEIGALGWIAAASSLGSAYGSVSGAVVSSKGSPITGASVWSGSQFKVTDTTGGYSLTNLPAGANTVNAAASGYNSNSVTVTVVSGSNVAAPNIVLTATSALYGTIAGKITDSSTSGPVPGAKVLSGDKTAFTNSSGEYVLTNVPAGSSTVTVFAYGYLNKSQPVSVTQGTTSTLDFALDPVAVSAFTDDFETDKGWNVSSTFPRNLWHRAENLASITDKLAPTYVTLPDYASTGGAIPSARSGTHTYWFGDDDKGCYIGNQLATDTPLSGGWSDFAYYGDLTSPAISLVGFSDVTLSFWTWWEIESMNAAAGFDEMFVKISDDGGSTWRELDKLNPASESPDKKNWLPHTSAGFNTPGIWVRHQYDLSSYAGKTVMIRFSFWTKDTKYNGFRGWFIDDVSVSPVSLSSLKR